jgi:hypothetical protein
MCNVQYVQRLIINKNSQVYDFNFSRSAVTELITGEARGHVFLFFFFSRAFRIPFFVRNIYIFCISLLATLEAVAAIVP